MKDDDACIEAIGADRVNKASKSGIERIFSVIHATDSKLKFTEIKF